MEYITTKEASSKWGISTTRITILANEGRIPGAQRLGKSWLIPAGADRPKPLKAHQAGNMSDKFSFPLYHFRPDFGDSLKAKLSPQQQTLLLAETAIMECRFWDAYPILETILKAPEDTVTEIGCLFNMGLCCIALNKPNGFSRAYLRLEMLLASDFPHRDNLFVTLDLIKTYVETIDSFAKNYICNIDVNYQAFPLTCVVIGYNRLARELLNYGKADIFLLEANLVFLKNAGATLAIEFMHCYLMGINYMRENDKEAEKHAMAAVQIAYENKLYFPLLTFCYYYPKIFEPILDIYPKEFREYLHEHTSKFAESYIAFIAYISENSLFSKLTQKDYSYSQAVFMGLTNTQIAEKLGVSKHTVKHRISVICEKLGVQSKQELIEYLHKYS